LCTGVSMLSEEHARTHKFLHRPGVSGNVLLQTATGLQTTDEAHEMDIFEEDEL